MSGAFLAALAAASVAAAAPAGGERLSVIFVGDTGLNASGAPVAAEGGFKYDQLVTFADATAAIAPHLGADLVFANLETAVMDRNDIPPREKMFVFRTHPNAVRDFVRLGINMFSLANNHTLDFGPRGAGETLRHVAALASEGLKAWPGLARTKEEALTPHVFEAKGARVAVSAIGIGGGWLPSPEGEAGMLIEPDDYPELVRRLKEERTDLSILSIHYGRELYPLTEEDDIARFRREAASETATIVVGHHAHVPKGIEIAGNHLVLYGLGNFLHPGMADMASRDICRDFGVMVRAGLVRGADGALAIETVEALPLRAMHIRTEAMTGDDARLRLDVLNYLGGRLDHEEDGARGLRFAAQADGSGLWCASGAGDPRCEAWAEPALASGERGRQIAAACGLDIRRRLVAGLEPEPGADEEAAWPPSGPAPAEYRDPSKQVDVATIDKWARAKIVRYTLAGEFFGRTEISAAGGGVRGDVSDRVFVAFDWDPNARRILGEPAIDNAASKIANITSPDAPCAPAAAAFENFTLTDARVSTDGARLVLTGERTRSDDGACDAAQRVSARILETPVPSPMLLGMPERILRDQGLERSSDGRSLILREGGWTWTFTPEEKTP